MPKKRSPILEKVSNFMKISIKMSKPITLNLILFKKSLRNSKKFKVRRHHHNTYGFTQDYQFSPSNTPLILHHYKQHKRASKAKRKDFYSMLVMCMCLGGFGGQARDEVYYDSLPMEAFPAIKDKPYYISSYEDEQLEMADLSGSEDEYYCSVDERAERFIENFYEQMRMQRGESSCALLPD